jgi:hypothetical protein
MMTGERRYWQAMTKARILSNRNLRKFLADELPWLPQSKDREFIISEFDRLHHEIGRLRAIVRVNGLRWGHTHAEIDKLLEPARGASSNGGFSHDPAPLSPSHSETP